jgi:hypothetical protein
MRTRKNLSPTQSSTLNFRRALQASLLTATALTALSIGHTARAQDFSGQETLQDFGNLLNQNSTTYVDPSVGGLNVGPDACVPTAVAQGLSFLENYQTVALGNPDPFTQSPNNVQAINNLAKAMGTEENPLTMSFGTDYPGRVTGTMSYLSPTGANPSSAYVVGGQYAARYSPAPNIGPTVQSTMQAVSTAQFLAGGLNANFGVEFGILWGSLDTATDVYTQKQGGHFVTLQEIDYNAATGTGTIDFIDPGSAKLIEGTLTKTTDGNLYVSYPGAPVPPPDNGQGAEEAVFGDNLDGGIPAGQLGGIIINDMAEAVPDNATTATLLGASLFGLLALRRRYCFC